MSWLEWLVALLAVAGSLFVLLGSVALVKLPDFYTRLHGPTKATTLGLGALVLASIVYFNFVTGELSLQQLLIALFLFITAPITAHMLVKAALHLKLKTSAHTSGKQNADL
ncbi:Na+/H+ antiporter subunit G [Rheinheimera soli]|jgi:multicomponent K+:H+ antiporter subunit G|uniref:Multicomponent K+:H+ antiporter subunit G n=1 Tax=Rheinheimera soli TaxID=443616 RepID=A0ABU1VYG2_9GAMM|nr:Na+/H+ antiporter subunit G [Rheinheimera soli]MDR7120761.1 multicomponent K+:H+ antiporter subunit G [Rheinheimera soli]